MLFIVFLPSSTILGIEVKSEFNNTKSDTLYAAELPQARAILQSDSLRANTSFTPSPTIETVCPNLFNSLIIILF